jgi:hypothetical protein
MGLFGRKDKSGAGLSEQTAAAVPAAPAGPSEAAFGHAAFAAGDVDDARRGHPAHSLQPFADANGLEYRDQSISARFCSTQPAWAEYTFNCCRGALPGGRYGQIGHELLELEASEGSIREGGTFHDVRVTTHRSLGEMAGLGPAEVPNVPFAGNAVWVPITTVHVRAPEINQLPLLAVRRSGEVVLGRASTDRHGLPGFRLRRGPADDGWTAAMVGAIAPALLTRGDPFVQLRSRYGLVAVSVNGYRSDPADLLALVGVAVAATEALVALTSPAPADAFAAAGPPPGSVPVPQGVPLPHPANVPRYGEAESELGMHNEDPHHLARALPGCVVPGAASGVLFGTIPGTSATGRLVWCEHGGTRSGALRSGAVVPAAAGASTPLGGVLHEPTGMCVEVADGVAHAWRIELLTNQLQADRLVVDARAALTAIGAASL